MRFLASRWSYCCNFFATRWRNCSALFRHQVEVLEKEMSHTGGVKVMLRRTDCHHTIALVDYKGKVW